VITRGEVALALPRRGVNVEYVRWRPGFEQRVCSVCAGHVHDCAPICRPSRQRCIKS